MGNQMEPAILRQRLLERLDSEFDLVIVGGGITGAGIFHEAASQGYRTLLIEQKDFSCGTSSRSAKLVHGGLRYLKNGQIRTMLHSISEREKILRCYSRIVKPIPFLVPVDSFGFRLMLKAGLSIYDLAAGRLSHRYYDQEAFSMLIPSMERALENGGYSFLDAITDDAQLVLQVIDQGIEQGGTAINYCEYERIVESKGRIVGIVARDKLSGQDIKIKAPLVINATGIFSDRHHSKVGRAEKLRALRGSHLIFPHWRFPVSQAISIIHPEDQRPLYILPWNGHTLVGTTDIDHDQPLDREPAISPAEGDYMFRALNHWFSELELDSDDLVSTFSGIRAVVDNGESDPSRASRDFAIWADGGFVSVTGGKLTTFRLIARQVLKAASKRLKHVNRVPERSDWRDVFDIELPVLNSRVQIGMIHSLDDLLLRRTRIGLLSKDGFIPRLPEIREVVQSLIGWDNGKWESETKKYRSIWLQSYSPDLLTAV